MREIKFRAWNKEENIMCYENEDFDADYWDGHYASLLEVINNSLKADRYIFMQYTGLKDKNGKEVYLGDILEYTFTDYKGKKLWKERYIIKENISGWEMRNITKPRGHRSLSLVKNYKIIGNIYENPKLLEDK